MHDAPLNLPHSDRLNIGALAGLFRHTTNSYKFIFFISLLDLLKRRQFNASQPYSYTDITVEMLATAWFAHTFFKLSFGTQDTIAKKLDSLNLDLGGSNLFAENKQALRAAFAATDLGDATRLMDFVPYRLLIPFLEPQLKDVDRASWMVFEKAMPTIVNANFEAQRPLYRFDSDNYSQCSSIMVHPEWAEYLKTHWSIIHGWVAWHWLHYMQRRNPTTPGISNKLFPPAKRNTLAQQTRYWRAILEHSDESTFRCIYSGFRLEPQQFALDHYLPWSFVAHDQLWNLIPVPPAVNASKSNNLPSMQYFIRFVEFQHRGLRIARTIFTKKEFTKFADSYLADLHLPLEDLCELDALQNAYSRNIGPLLTLATNQGFSPDWKYSGLLQSTQLA